jgi:arginase
MNIQIIQVPYDSGHEGARTGKGPDHFIQNGIEQILQKNGHVVNVTRVESRIPFSTEIGTTFEVNRLLAECVRSATGNNHFPLVLAGNCNSCVGTIAGIDSKRLGIIWFDAHGDFNTPETTVTGFLDGMGLAMAANRCWRSLLRTIPGFNPVSEDCIVHVGSRDLDMQERKMFEEAHIPLLTKNPIGDKDILSTFEAAIITLKNRVDGVYVHIDMDVLETEQGKPNHLAVPDGLPSGLVEKAIRMIKEHLKIEGCAIASFDPDYDKDNSVLNDGFRLINAFLSD